MNKPLLPPWRIYPKKLIQDKTGVCGWGDYLKQTFATFSRKNKTGNNLYVQYQRSTST